MRRTSPFWSGTASAAAHATWRQESECTAPSEVAAIEAHLAICEGCQRYLDQMRATLAALGSMPVQTLSDDARNALLSAFPDRQPVASRRQLLAAGDRPLTCGNAPVRTLACDLARA